MQTILLVDDEPEVLETLADTLTSFGYEVIPKTEVLSAMTVVKAGTVIDLVITDLKMPGVSGSEFILMLKSARPAVPVIVLTAYGSVQSYIESHSKGVFEYVNKPVQAKELRRIVKAALTWPGAGHAAAPL